MRRQQQQQQQQEQEQEEQQRQQRQQCTPPCCPAGVCATLPCTYPPRGRMQGGTLPSPSSPCCCPKGHAWMHETPARPPPCTWHWRWGLWGSRGHCWGRGPPVAPWIAWGPRPCTMLPWGGGGRVVLVAVLVVVVMGVVWMWVMGGLHWLAFMPSPPPPVKQWQRSSMGRG